MNTNFKQYIKKQLDENESELQNSLKQDRESLNFSSSDYLALSKCPEIESRANQLMEQYGLGLSSMFYGSGSHEIHNMLAQKISDLFGKEDTLVYAADGSLFEPLFAQEDAIITDELTHINLTGNIRFCNAARYTYKHSNMRDLESQLMLSQAQRFRIIATDGLFAVDGDIAIDAIDDKMIDKALATNFMPDPDLLIRTGKEQRLSNFLLWQCAYSEFYFTDVLWPEFDNNELCKAVYDYQQRQRRYGKTGEQVEETAK